MPASADQSPEGTLLFFGGGGFDTGIFEGLYSALKKNFDSLN